jgi:rhodanese-related sulfurtransferase
MHLKDILLTKEHTVIDVRSPEEFAVSHLRGAINLRSVNEIAAAAREREASNVVLYCAVGFRSSRLAQALSGQGLAKVMNLEGSIFQWANEGHPVYQEETQVQKVHPYGKRWTGLLKPGLASEC